MQAASASTSSTSASSSSAANGPLSLDTIDRDTLITLLKRKEKGLKSQTNKLLKAEEGYVKVVKEKRLLEEAVTPFVAAITVHEGHTGVFRANPLVQAPSGSDDKGGGGSQESLDLEQLQLLFSELREYVSRSLQDRETILQFLQMIFPNDTSIAHMLQHSASGAGAGSRSGGLDFDLLRAKWMAYEELSSESIAAVQTAAREAIKTHEQQMEEVLYEKNELDLRVKDLEASLQQIHKEKAQLLLSHLKARPHGHGHHHIAPTTGLQPRNPVSDTDEDIEREVETQSCGVQTGGGEESDDADLQPRTAPAVCVEMGVQAAGDANEREKEAARLRSERDKLREELQTTKAQCRELLRDQEKLKARLQLSPAPLPPQPTTQAPSQSPSPPPAAATSSSSASAAAAAAPPPLPPLAPFDAVGVGGNGMGYPDATLQDLMLLDDVAERQARAEMKLAEMRQTLAEADRTIALGQQQEKVLKARIRELEGGSSRSQVNMDYLKSVVFKYAEYGSRSRFTDSRQKALLPVLATLLAFDKDEMEKLQIDPSTLPPSIHMPMGRTNSRQMT